MTTEKLFTEPELPFLKNAISFSRVLTRVEIDQLVENVNWHELAGSVGDYCIKRKLLYDETGVMYASQAVDGISKTRHGIFNIDSIKTKNCVRFLQIAFASKKKGILCISKKDDTNAFLLDGNWNFFDSKKRIWYNPQHPHSKEVVRSTSSLELEILHPTTGFIPIRDIVFDIINGKAKDGSIMDLYNSLYTLA